MIEYLVANNLTSVNFPGVAETPFLMTSSTSSRLGNEAEPLMYLYDDSGGQARGSAFCLGTSLGRFEILAYWPRKAS